MPSPVRLSVVCNVCALTQPVEIFGNVSTPFGTVATGHPLKSTENFTKSRGTPPPWGLNTRGVAKHSDFGSNEGYISETVEIS